MKSSSQQQLILQEPLAKVMWTLALPAIAAMMLFGLNAFMDTIYIGQLMNETALAGVALAYPLTGLMMGFGSLAGTGAANLLSIVLGREDIATQAKILSNATLVCLFSSALFALPAYIFADELIIMMGGSGQVLAYGAHYFRITLLAAPLWVFGLSLNFVVRGEGRMATAARMMAYGLVLNIILTPLLIRYGDLGVGGAAWATNAGMLVYCIVGYLYFKQGRASFEGNIDSLAFDKEVFWSILRLGFPGFILTAMGFIQSIVVFNAIVGVGGERELAFFAAANRIMLFMMTPLFGLMRALQPLAGVNYGAEQYDRTKASYWLFVKTGFWMVFPFWVLMMIFPTGSLRLVLPDFSFTAEDLLYFRIYLFMLPFLPLVFNALTWLPAIERPRYA
ncbi:MAG: MATE family efflux transporter, partial [Bacteroidota bacterium]